MPNYMVRIATKDTPGMRDLDEMEVLPDIMTPLGPVKLIDQLYTLDGNDLIPINAPDPASAARDYFYQIAVHSDLHPVPNSELSQIQILISWDQACRWLEVHEEVDPDTTIVRIFSINDIEVNLQANLEAKSTLVSSDIGQGICETDLPTFKIDP